MTAQRKAMASLRMVRIRRAQDWVAMQSVHAASDLLAQVQEQSGRMDSTREMLMPDMGTHRPADIAARLEMATRLSIAQSQLREKAQQLIARQRDAQDQQQGTKRALRMAEKFAQSAAQALDAETEARMQRDARPKTRRRP